MVFSRSNHGLDDLAIWPCVEMAEGRQGGFEAVGSSIQERSWEWDWLTWEGQGGGDQRVAGRLAWHSTSCGRRFPCHSHTHSTPIPHWPGNALAFSQISKFG